MQKETVSVGVDIGGTNTEVGIVRNSGEIILESSFRTRDYASAAAFVAQLKRVIRAAWQQLTPGYDCRGIGIAAPGVNRDGTVEAPANLDWGKLNLRQLLGEAFGCPVKTINDADAAALGELTYGAAQNMRNFLVITLGTGVGAGVVVNGQIMTGENGLAGEIGHTIVFPDGRPCNCGRKGCLETYVSANGIRRTALELMASGVYDSSLEGLESANLTAEHVTEAARHGDPLALEVVERTAEILGRALANAVALFDPEAIFLIGGVMQAGQVLFVPVQRHFNNSLLHLYKNRVRLMQSRLRMNWIGVLGASVLVNGRKGREALFAS